MPRRPRSRSLSLAATLLSVPAAAHAQGSEAQAQWWDPLVFSASVGMPKLASDDIHVIGDATLGYSTPSFGVVAKGSIAYFDVETPTAFWNTYRAGGSGDFWYVTGEERSTARLEVRVSGGANVFSSTFIPRTSAAGYFHDEDSLLGRGLLLLGGRVRAETFSASLLGGAGFQLESYSTLSIDPKINDLFHDSDSLSLRGEGRLRLRWAFLPDTLALRVRADGSYFELTRDDIIVRTKSQGGGVQSTQATFKTLDLSSRLFFDVDALSFLGISPGVFAGLDVLKLSTDAGSTSTVVPSGGVGLFKLE